MSEPLGDLPLLKRSVRRTIFLALLYYAAVLSLILTGAVSTPITRWKVVPPEWLGTWVGYGAFFLKLLITYRVWRTARALGHDLKRLVLYPLGALCVPLGSIGFPLLLRDQVLDRIQPQPQIGMGPGQVRIDTEHLERAAGRLARDAILYYVCFALLIAAVLITVPALQSGSVHRLFYLPMSLFDFGLIFFKLSVPFRMWVVTRALGRRSWRAIPYQMGALFVPLGTLAFALDLRGQARKAIQAGRSSGPVPREPLTPQLAGLLIPPVLLALLVMIAIPGLLSARANAGGRKYRENAIALLSQGKTQEALAEYEKVVRMQSWSPSIHREFASALMKAGQPERALEELSSTLPFQLDWAEREPETRPELAENYYLMGLALKSAGRPNEAVEALTESVRWHPLQADSYYELGPLLRERGHLALARECFQHFIGHASPQDTERLGQAKRWLRDLESEEAGVVEGSLRSLVAGPPKTPPPADGSTRSFPVTVYLKNGKEISGTLISRDADRVRIRKEDGTEASFSSGEVMGVIELSPPNPS